MAAEETLSAAKGFIASLTLPRVLLALTLAGGGILLYGLWEARTSWSQVAWQSPVLLAVVGGGLFLTILGWILNSQQNRLVQVQDALVAQLRQHNTNMEQAISIATSRMHELEIQLANLRGLEAACQARVRHLEESLEEQAKSLDRRFEDLRGRQ
jgi:hypothetical protein